MLQTAWHQCLDQSPTRPSKTHVLTADPHSSFLLTLTGTVCWQVSEYFPAASTDWCSHVHGQPRAVGSLASRCVWRVLSIFLVSCDADVQWHFQFQWAPTGSAVSIVEGKYPFYAQNYKRFESLLWEPRSCSLIAHASWCHSELEHLVIPDVFMSRASHFETPFPGMRLRSSRTSRWAG